MKFRWLAVLVPLVGLVAFVVWPSPIDPLPFATPPERPATGALAPNEALRAARLIPLQHGHGAESLAVAADGSVYSGNQEGDVLRFAPDGTEEVLANTGGRPLGVELDAEGRLVIADAYRGLLRMTLSNRSVEVLTTEAEGVKFGFTDDLAIASDGVIYFTDASDTWPQAQFINDILEMRPHGRLLRYDPATRQTTVLARDLMFANGVALSRDESFLVVNETSTYRVLRYWLRGERTGELEIFLDELPGFPDNVTSTGRGTFWVALYTVRKPLLDFIHAYPFVKRVFAKLPAWSRPGPTPYGYALEVDENGVVLRTVQDPSGEHLRIVTTALEHEGQLYLGSLMTDVVGVLPLAPRP